MYIYTIYILYIYEVKLVTVVEGDQKHSFFNSYNTDVLGRALLLFP